LSETYRAAVEGHTPWTADTTDAEPIVVADVHYEPSLAPYVPTIEAEGIAAMGFIPLVSLSGVIGKFMLYYDKPYALTTEDLQLAGVVAAQVAFAVERIRAENNARRSESRLRFALDAASMGTWDWDLETKSVRWSEDLERLHGLPKGFFDGTFASYEREIHPDDRERVLEAARRAIENGVPYEVEYRMLAPDGSVRWVEGKGTVEYDGDRPVRMTGVCMLVTRRKEAELARLALAEEANRLKDEFLATLSHELRTPLNAILGWAQIVTADSLPPDRLRRAFDIIARNAKLQGQLIEDILDVSRIVSGKLEIERVPVKLAQLLDELISGLLPQAGAKRIRVSRSISPDLPPVDGDPQRLQQIFGNVISNAIKFTPEGGEISIDCEAEGDGTTINVRDTGIGIKPDFLPFVFDRFRQGDSRITRKHGGLGLGLAIARHLIEKHGGSIEAHSDGEGLGTLIRIHLPSAGAAREALLAAGAWQHPELPQLDGTTVLIVEDQPDSASMLRELFAGCGATVMERSSALEAIEDLGSSNVGLLIADIAMPEMDGYQLIAWVRANTRSLPAIAVSAHARPLDRRRALDAGFDAYCAKPVDTGQLFRAVREVLGGR
jgi:PAS domain S-box-containing protein